VDKKREDKKRSDRTAAAIGTEEQVAIPHGKGQQPVERQKADRVGEQPQIDPGGASAGIAGEIAIE
jgi:hypothetical protein